MSHKHLDDDENKDLTAEFTSEEVGEIEDEVKTLIQGHLERSESVGSVDDLSEDDINFVAEKAIDRAVDWDSEKMNIVYDLVKQVAEREIERLM